MSVSWDGSRPDETAMLTGQTFQQHQPMQMPQVMPALPLVIRPSPGRGARPQVFSCAIFTSSGRQESPSASIIEATKKRDIETVTEVVGAAPSPRSEAAGVAAAPQRRDPTERLLQLQRTRRVMMTEYL